MTQHKQKSYQAMAAVLNEICEECQNCTKDVHELIWGTCTHQMDMVQELIQGNTNKVLRIAR